MSDPFIGEIRPVGFNFAPQGWALCDGQQMSISQNNALFAIIGTTYGGDGVQTFALPDLRGRMPVHVGGTLPIGAQSGSNNCPPLTQAQMPAHTHAMNASTAVSHANDPTGHVLGSVELGGLNTFHVADGSASLHPSSVSPSGTATIQPHNNMQPFAVCNFVIALFGIFPTRN